MMISSSLRVPLNYLFLQPKTAGVLTHVDDLEAVCELERCEELNKHLAAAGLTISREGPLTLDLGRRKFLKRTMQAVEGGIFIEQDKKRIQKLVEITGTFEAIWARLLLALHIRVSAQTKPCFRVSSTPSAGQS